MSDDPLWQVLWSDNFCHYVQGKDRAAAMGAAASARGATDARICSLVRNR